MTETFVQNDGARLWTVAQGAGIPVLLCNGGPGCCDYLAPVAAMLDDLAQVIRFEARGCGRSDAAFAYDVAGAIGDLEAIREHYGVEHWIVIVGGHSWEPTWRSLMRSSTPTGFSASSASLGAAS